MKIFQFGQALVDSPDTTTDENIIRHPRQFMESIESAIECLDDMEHKVAPVFLNLGKLKDDVIGILRVKIFIHIFIRSIVVGTLQ